MAGDVPVAFRALIIGITMAVVFKYRFESEACVSA